MTPETVITIGQGAVITMLKVAGPILLVMLVAGVVIGIIQAATQVNETTLSFVPKVLAAFAVMAILAPWIGSTMIDFTKDLFKNIPTLIG